MAINRKLITTSKADVADWVAEQFKELRDRPTAMSRKLIEYLNSLDHDPKVENLLKQLFIVNHILYNRWQAKLLTDIELAKIEERVYNTLKLLNIKAGESKFSNLFGEYHLAKSNFRKKQGNYLQSIWEQQLSRIISKNAPIENNRSLQSFAFANRLMRLAHFKMAKNLFVQLLDKKDLSQSMTEKIRINMLKIYRLCHDWDDYQALQKQLESDGQLSEQAALEIEWEKALVEYLDQRKKSQIAKMCSFGKSHYDTTYIIEAKLIGFASEDSALSEKLGKIETYAKNLKIKKVSTNIDASIVEHLENFSEAIGAGHHAMRIEADMVEKINALTTIDKELLATLALARMLANLKIYDLAAVFLAEYGSLSQKISDGKTNDSMSIGADLFEKHWYQRRS